MYTLVHEQAPLHELTAQVTDWLGEGREVVHGPWQPHECQSVLLPWHEAGWIELVAHAPHPVPVRDAAWRDRATRVEAYLVLSAVDASALLRDPSRWTVDTADGHVMLCLSEEGSRHEYPEWLLRANPPTVAT